MPIFGITASSGLETRLLGDFESIATTTLSVAASSVTFSSIPQTYSHLHLRVSIRNTSASADSFSLLTLNSTASYTHYLLGTGSSTVSGSNANSIFSAMGWGTNNSWNAANFSANIIDILDYANTNKFKTVKFIT